MLAVEQAVDQQLTGPALEELLAGLEQGELSFNSAVARLTVEALAEWRRSASATEQSTTAQESDHE